LGLPRDREIESVFLPLARYCAGYVAAASVAGFRLRLFEDVSRRTRDFWSLTIALYEAEQRALLLSPWEETRLHEAREVHALMRRGLYDGGLRYALVSFAKD
jgi:hypothetical protein